ncbi:MAG TPA: hypothetical protein DCG34_03510 [Clostridiales bacterium]|nr:hypothetical protein [Clostridiales bacterium]
MGRQFIWRAMAKPLFILGIVFSFFVKVFYLQYTIGLSLVPFQNNMLIHRLLLFSTVTVVMFILLVFQKKATYILVGFNLLFSALLLLDTIYGRYYGIPLTIPII